MSGEFPLLIEWSPSRVRVYDPGTGQSVYGPTLAECRPAAGRDAVVAISRRSAFVRSLTVPAASANQIATVIGFQMSQSLPLGPAEVVFGFRLGANVPGKGRLAAVGAVRAESLTRIHDEAKACGLRVRAVVPVAFGAWLASRQFGDCAVVGVEADVLNIDLIKDGELLYSRSVPSADPFGDAEGEIARTFAIAEIAPLPILTVAAPEIPAERHDPKEALEYLADLKAIDRQLFNLESPARREARLRRAERWKAQRALATALVAVILGLLGYGAHRHAPAPRKPSNSAALARTQRDQREAQERSDLAGRANRVLDVAFRPAQSISDVVRALTNEASADVWFTSLAVGRGVPVSVSGLALHEREITHCLSAVANDPRFSGMKVVSTSKSVVGKVPVTQFLIMGNAVGTLPFDRPQRRKETVKAQPVNR